MARLIRFVGSPFGVAVVGLLVLAGWAVSSAGLFEGELARQVRGSSVYVAPGVDVEAEAAERVVGNRRLVVVFLDRDGDFRQACEETEGAAAGTLVVFFKPGEGEFDHYGCGHFADDDEFGKAYVSETVVPQGADQFLARPLDAVKVLVVNYDSLVRSGTVPDGARAIEPSLPRYLLAGAAVLTVVGGAVTVFLGGRRMGRLTARYRDGGEVVSDARASVRAKAAVLAGYIIDLDRRAGREEHRKLAADFAELAAELSGEVTPELVARVEALTVRARDLARTAAPSRRRRSRASSR